MFCPNCGTQLPDAAAFCGKCGTQLRVRAQQQPVASAGMQGSVYGAQQPGANGAQQPGVYGNPYSAAPAAVGVPARNLTRAASTSLGFTTLGIVGRVLALIALILLFMPIVAIPAMASLSSYIGVDLSSYSNELMRYGINMNDINMLMSGTYSALDLNTLCQMAAKMDGSSSAGYYAIFGYIIVFGLVIMAALIVGGLIMSFVNTKSTKLVRVGGIVVAGMAISLAFSLIVANMMIQQELANSYYGMASGYFRVEVPITLWLLIICALVSFIVLEIDAKQQLNGAVEYPDPMAVGSIASCFTGLYGIVIAIVAIVRNKDTRNKRLAIIGLLINIALILISVFISLTVR